MSDSGALRGKGAGSPVTVSREGTWVYPATNPETGPVAVFTITDGSAINRKG